VKEQDMFNKSVMIEFA